MKTLFFFGFLLFFHLFSSCILVVAEGGFLLFIYNDLIGSLYRFFLHILVGLYFVSR